ncbi:MAG: hypothetical protein JRD93_19925 [Deltaproteobacteria bacterium]|nr:hypothetical protein [Deltaproteobacteria bacterium]
MKLFLYAPDRCRSGKRLQRVIEALVPKENTEIYQSIDGFAFRLRQPRHDPLIAVLLAASSEDLSDILSLRDLLGNIRIMLILPDRDRDTIAKGHTLRPRFVTYADSDFVEMAAILGKVFGG